jgi:hypothetical protein
MSTRYHIDGKDYTADYIRSTYRTYFEKANDSLSYYLGVRIPIEFKNITIKFPSECIEVKTKCFNAPFGQNVIVYTDLKIPYKTDPNDIGIFDLVHTLPAHELAESIFYNVRFNLDEVEEVTTYIIYAYYRFLGEMFSEVYRNVFCQANHLNFKPLHIHNWFERTFKGKKHDPEFETFYKHASFISKTLSHRPIEFNLAFLRALLFQKLDSIGDDVDKQLKREFFKAYNYAKGRT